MAATTFHGEAERLIDADSAFVEGPDVQLHLARSRTFSPLRSSRDQETISPKSLMSPHYRGPSDPHRFLHSPERRTDAARGTLQNGRSSVMNACPVLC